MKHKIFYFFLILFVGVTNFLWAGVVDDQGKVLPEVVEIFKCYQELIEKEADLPTDLKERIFEGKGELKDFNQVAQKTFLRPSGLERYQVAQFNAKFVPYTTQEVFDLFDAIGDLKEVIPEKKEWDYILLNGSTVQNMRDRIQGLIHLLQQGKIIITPSKTQVVFLTGKRSFFPEETEEVLKNPSPLKLNPLWVQPAEIPTSEEKAAEWIWDQSDLPDVLRALPITFVSAPQKRDPLTGHLRRPNTRDTVETWIQEFKPTPGHCLSISSQPFVGYQKETTRGIFKSLDLLEKGFTVEGAGIEVPSFSSEFLTSHVSLLLDNLARTLYTELQNRS